VEYTIGWETVVLQIGTAFAREDGRQNRPENTIQR